MRDRKRTQLGVLTSLACTLALGCARTRGEIDVQGASERVVSTPSAIAVLSQAEAVSGLPEQVSFGATRGRSALYLRFAPEWRRSTKLPLKAFISLEPRENSAPDATPVTIEVWRVHADWLSAQLHSWSDKPQLALPYARSSAQSSPARALRIDVTELLRFAAQHPDTDYGFALIAAGGSGHGASFSTGMAGGRAPELELYWR